MSKGLLFWILMILALVFSLYWHYPYSGGFAPLGMSLLVFILLALVGWQIFGAPLK